MANTKMVGASTLTGLATSMSPVIFPHTVLKKNTKRLAMIPTTKAMKKERLNTLCAFLASSFESLAETSLDTPTGML